MQIELVPELRTCLRWGIGCGQIILQMVSRRAQLVGKWNPESSCNDNDFSSSGSDDWSEADSDVN